MESWEVRSRLRRPKGKLERWLGVEGRTERGRGGDFPGLPGKPLDGLMALAR